MCAEEEEEYQKIRLKIFGRMSGIYRQEEYVLKVCNLFRIHTTINESLQPFKWY